MTLRNRFFPGVTRAKQLIDEGFPGQVLEFRAVYLHSGNADPDAPLKWKLTAEAGGGVIADLASHVLDAVYYLLGDYRSLLASNHVAYTERPLPGDPAQRVAVEAEDRATLLARMVSGAVGTVEATKIATGSEDEFILDLRIRCSRWTELNSLPQPRLCKRVSPVGNLYLAHGVSPSPVPPGDAVPMRP